MKTSELFEGIQRRTKQSLPRVLKFKGLFFPTGSGWSKQSVFDAFQERITEHAHASIVPDHMRNNDSIWKSMVGKSFKPNDLSDKDMEEFVLDWEYASDIEQNDRIYQAQEDALEKLAKTLLKV